MKLIFLGPPGAGKGTQAAGICSHLNIPHISTGDMLRAALRNETPLGLVAKQYMTSGQLVPDSVINDLVRERLSESDRANGYLLDGFPRTVDQAKVLNTISAPDVVVNLDVPDELLMDRLTGRRVCRKCSGTYHISTLADPTVCPICRGEMYQRDDDKAETIANRLAVYHKQTEPLIDFYSQQGAESGTRLVTVNGNGKPEDVFKAILASLE